MTTRAKRSAKSSRIEALVGDDRELFKGLLKESLQEVLEAEMTAAVGAGPGERTTDRVGYRSGYYSRGLVTRIGKLELRVPRDREGRFSTELFDRFQRSEKALVSALAEMYVQGVSTRKVKAVTEELCGHTFSASTVSRINKSLDGLLRRFAERRLDEVYPYLILDARYEKVRLDGVIQSQAVFIALGINEEGRRQVLGVELSNRESRSSWTAFVTELKTRGLHGVEFVVSDDHAGLKRAVRELLPEAVWQRCYVHFLRNALDYLPRKADDDCRQELRWLYDRRNLKEAQQDLQAWLTRWATRYPKLTDWVEAHIDVELLQLAAATPQASEVDQHARAAQRRDQTPHPGRAHLPEPGELLTLGPRALRRSPRRLARGSSLLEHGVPEGAEERTADRRLTDHSLSHESAIAQLDVHNPRMARQAIRTTPISRKTSSASYLLSLGYFATEVAEDCPARPCPPGPRGEHDQSPSHVPLFARTRTASSRHYRHRSGRWPGRNPAQSDLFATPPRSQLVSSFRQLCWCFHVSYHSPHDCCHVTTQARRAESSAIYQCDSELSFPPSSAKKPGLALRRRKTSSSFAVRSVYGN